MIRIVELDIEVVRVRAGYDGRERERPRESYGRERVREGERERVPVYYREERSRERERPRERVYQRYSEERRPAPPEYRERGRERVYASQESAPWDPRHVTSPVVPQVVAERESMEVVDDSESEEVCYNVEALASVASQEVYQAPAPSYPHAASSQDPRDPRDPRVMEDARGEVQRVRRELSGELADAKMLLTRAREELKIADQAYIAQREDREREKKEALAIVEGVRAESRAELDKAQGELKQLHTQLRQKTAACLAVEAERAQLETERDTLEQSFKDERVLALALKEQCEHVEGKSREIVAKAVAAALSKQSVDSMGQLEQTQAELERVKASLQSTQAQLDKMKEAENARLTAIAKEKQREKEFEERERRRERAKGGSLLDSLEKRDREKERERERERAAAQREREINARAATQRREVATLQAKLDAAQKEIKRTNEMQERLQYKIDCQNGACHDFMDLADSLEAQLRRAGFQPKVGSYTRRMSKARQDRDHNNLRRDSNGRRHEFLVHLPDGTRYAGDIDRDGGSDRDRERERDGRDRDSRDRERGSRERDNRSRDRSRGSSRDREGEREREPRVKLPDRSRDRAPRYSTIDSSVVSTRTGSKGEPKDGGWSQTETPAVPVKASRADTMAAEGEDSDLSETSDLSLSDSPPMPPPMATKPDTTAKADAATEGEGEGASGKQEGETGDVEMQEPPVGTNLLDSEETSSSSAPVSVTQRVAQTVSTVTPVDTVLEGKRPAEEEAAAEVVPDAKRRPPTPTVEKEEKGEKGEDVIELGEDGEVEAAPKVPPASTQSVPKQATPAKGGKSVWASRKAEPVLYASPCRQSTAAKRDGAEASVPPAASPSPTVSKDTTVTATATESIPQANAEAEEAVAEAEQPKEVAVDTDAPVHPETETGDVEMVETEGSGPQVEELSEDGDDAESAVDMTETVPTTEMVTAEDATMPSDSAEAEAEAVVVAEVETETETVVPADTSATEAIVPEAKDTTSSAESTQSGPSPSTFTVTIGAKVPSPSASAPVRTSRLPSVVVAHARVVRPTPSPSVAATTGTGTMPPGAPMSRPSATRSSVVIPRAKAPAPSMSLASTLGSGGLGSAGFVLPPGVSPGTAAKAMPQSVARPVSKLIPSSVVVRHTLAASVTGSPGGVPPPGSTPNRAAPHPFPASSLSSVSSSTSSTLSPGSILSASTRVSTVGARAPGALTPSPPMDTKAVQAKMDVVRAKMRVMEKEVQLSRMSPQTAKRPGPVPIPVPKWQPGAGMMQRPSPLAAQAQAQGMMGQPTQASREREREAAVERERERLRAQAEERKRWESVNQAYQQRVSGTYPSSQGMSGAQRPAVGGPYGGGPVPVYGPQSTQGQGQGQMYQQRQGPVPMQGQMQGQGQYAQPQYPQQYGYPGSQGQQQHQQQYRR
ncbi:hypothetical protein KIPB_000855 [Kipferlia bialata]|uniref:Uncharacterized protein n=1 Tax=Kipferlia bialata TaxID=797122 RepID=A0A9K3CN48_9EUKA|nr:hypothetical protein KIPB_000855 [Kipferlia bialata]|eukprot:g855.t1